MTKLIMSVFVVSVLCSLSVHGVACVKPQQTASIRSTLEMSLDVLGASVDAASELSHKECVARQDAQNDEVRAGKIDTTQAGTKIAEIRARCMKLKDVFDKLRTLHDQAAEFVETDQIEAARVKLDEVRALWRKVPEEGGAP